MVLSTAQDPSRRLDVVQIEINELPCVSVVQPVAWENVIGLTRPDHTKLLHDSNKGTKSRVGLQK